MSSSHLLSSHISHAEGTSSNPIVIDGPVLTRRAMKVAPSEPRRPKRVGSFAERMAQQKAKHRAQHWGLYARLYNTGARHRAGTTIVLLKNNLNRLPPRHLRVRTLRALHNLTDQNIDQLLCFYGIRLEPNANRTIKLDLLHWHLGVHP